MAADRNAFVHKLAAPLRAASLARAHADAIEPTARAAFEALAGLPHFEQVVYQPVDLKKYELN